MCLKLSMGERCFILNNIGKYMLPFLLGLMSASLRVNEFTWTSVFSEVQLQYPRVSHQTMRTCFAQIHLPDPTTRSYPDYGMVAQTKDGQILSLAWHFTTWMRIQFFLPKKCEKTIRYLQRDLQRSTNHCQPPEDMPLATLDRRTRQWKGLVGQLGCTWTCLDFMQHSILRKTDWSKASSFVGGKQASVPVHGHRLVVEVAVNPGVARGRSVHFWQQVRTPADEFCPPQINS